ELVVDEEFDAGAVALGLVLEGPDVFEMAEWPVDIFDPHIESGFVESDPARERLANELVADRHTGDQRFAALIVDSPAAYLERLAQGYEFRVALDVGDECEHLRGPVAYPALIAEGGQGSRTSGARVGVNGSGFGCGSGRSRRGWSWRRRLWRASLAFH